MKIYKPLISIVVAVKNGNETIRNLVQSFTEQTYKQSELILVDGGSTDGTIEYLESLENDESIAILIGRDRGIAEAWNKGVEAGRGEWFVFIGSDDVLSTATILERVASTLESSSEFDLVYGQIELVSSDSRMQIGSTWEPKKFLRRMTIPHPAAFLRSSYFKEYGLFDSDFTIAMDYELLLRKIDIRCRFCPAIVTVMDAGGVSGTKVTKSLRESFSAKIKNSRQHIFAAVFWFLIYWFRDVVLTRANVARQK